MRIPRLHLFELEDQPWFPAIVRDLATDYLRFLERRFRFHLHALPILSRAIQETETKQVVDLCSGGAGPIPELARELRDAEVDVRFLLTDLYPNLNAFKEAHRQDPDMIDFVPEPVDARDVPNGLVGLRTFFNAFHHFDSSDAVAILESAADAGQPIAVLEVPERSVHTILPLVLTPLLVWLGTPFIRPVSWRRYLLTYLIPAVPLTCLWDGLVSQFRAYRPDELEALAQRTRTPNYVWEAGTYSAPSVPGKLTYLLGRPTENVDLQ